MGHNNLRYWSISYGIGLGMKWCGCFKAKTKGLHAAPPAENHGDPQEGNPPGGADPLMSKN
jgi:hypothetical protein